MWLILWGCVSTSRPCSAAATPDPTRLSIASADVVIAVARNVAQTVRYSWTDHSHLYSGTVAPSLRDMLSVMAGWYYPRHGLYAASLACMASAVSASAPSVEMGNEEPDVASDDVASDDDSDDVDDTDAGAGASGAAEGAARALGELGAAQLLLQSPLLYSGAATPKTATRLVKTALQALLVELPQSTATSDGGGGDGAGADSTTVSPAIPGVQFWTLAGHLITAGLAVGRLASKTGLQMFLDAEIELPDLFGVFGHRLWAQEPTTRRLSKALLKLAFYSMAETDDSVDQLPQLMDFTLLGDGVANIAVELLVRIASRHPSEVLQHVFGVVDSDIVEQRVFLTWA